MDNSKRFDTALYGVGERIRNILTRLPPTVKNSAEEIRLRYGLPLALTVAGETVFADEKGQTRFYLTADLPKVTAEDLKESFRLLCGGSVYAHQEELSRGFIMMKNGCRAGIGGTLTEKGFMKDVTSVNIRISREVFGSANDILKSYNGGGLLIAGCPGSGKTTVLRDLLRQLSNGATGKLLRVAVVDSRGELAGTAGGRPVNDLGPLTDVLTTADKAAGIEIAVRTLYPDIVAFDEIGTTAELRRVKESFYAGVTVITTAHIGAFDELMRRDVTKQLILSGVISQIALLPRLHGGDIRIIDAKELSCAHVV